MDLFALGREILAIRRNNGMVLMILTMLFGLYILNAGEKRDQDGALGFFVWIIDMESRV